MSEATRIEIDLDDQPIIVLKHKGESKEFPADTFMLAVQEAGIGTPETKGTWMQDLTKVVEEVTGFKVGPLKAGQIYAVVLRLVKAYQKKAEENLGLGTTSDSVPTTSSD